jgi:chaperone modulatory protein CbpM
MTKKEIMIIADYTESTSLTLDELCAICGIPTDLVYEMMEFDIIHPGRAEPEAWEFDLVQLQRAKTAMRLHRDLEVNFAGIALVLQLMEELETLRQHSELLEKHLLKD